MELPNPVMSASGTSGFSTELSPYIDLAVPGAMVAKSLAPYQWEGNPYPRISEAPGGMLNSVGLQGPGIPAWIESHLPKLVETDARIVASIWGKTVSEFKTAAEMLLPVKHQLTALEINVSCPNIEDGAKSFSHSPKAVGEVVLAVSAALNNGELKNEANNKNHNLPKWVKLAPDTPDLNAVVSQAITAGADAITLTNSLPAMRIDTETQRPYLSGITGGFSGAALKSIALKAVYETYEAFPDLPIIGSGGVRSGEDVAQYFMAGASAVQVGAATFLNSRALVKIIKSLRRWCRKNSITEIASLKGAAHNLKRDTYK